MKKIIGAILVGICAGILVVIAERSLPDMYIIVGIWLALLAGVLVYNILYSVFFNRKIRRALALLEAGRTEEYITEIQRLRQRTSRKNIRNVLENDLAVGYIERKEYEKAAIILQNLSYAQLSGQMEIARRLNLCISYFYLGQTEQAMALYQDSQPFFCTKQADPIRGNLASLNVLAAIETEEPERAKALLKIARERWTDSRFQKTWDELEQRLAAKQY